MSENPQASERVHSEAPAEGDENADPRISGYIRRTLPKAPTYRTGRPPAAESLWILSNS